MGPRQIIGVAVSTRKPMLISLMPNRESGTITGRSGFGPKWRPVGLRRERRTWSVRTARTCPHPEGLPCVSASETATLLATVLLPTPPLPEAIRMMFLTPGIDWAEKAPPTAERTLAVTWTSTAQPFPSSAAFWLRLSFSASSPSSAGVGTERSIRSVLPAVATP